MLVVGRLMGMVHLGSSALREACDAAVGEKSPRAAACERIGRQIAANGVTLVDARLGFDLWHRQVEGSAAEADVIAAKRDYFWQYEHGVQLLSELQGSPQGMQRYGALVRASTSDELALIRDLVRERGIPLTPPREWMPARPDVLQARR